LGDNMGIKAIFLLLIFLFLFLRFFELEERMQFTWDQVENAWMMKNILIDGKLPLQGMVAKGNTGFYIGPGYYYLLAPFYKIFELDPVAGAYFAGTVSFITWLVLIVVAKRLFNNQTALLAGFLYAITQYIIGFDRIAWPVVFIPLISIAIFYFLWQVTQGNNKAFLFLALFQGFAFHFHFTAIFFLLFPYARSYL
jgi:4-amino-4-deoxy-L-arabinose transferase-like glycosyltransferase